MRVALVYDWVDKWGGAEQVLLAFHKMFPEAPLYTSVYNRTKAKWAERFKVVPSWLDNLPGEIDHERLFPLIPMAFEGFDFGGFDLVISVTSAFAKGIITKPGTKHVCYCLSPTRFLWRESERYRNRMPRGTRTLSGPIFSYLRMWDRVAAMRPDVVVTLSQYVAKGVEECYGRKVERVIYPAVPSVGGRVKRSERQDYFLVVSRLVPYKRLEVVIEAFKSLESRLVVVGEGIEEKFLKGIAGENVKFLGLVSEGEKAKLYEEARAVIVPQVEDFGLVALEANACGTSVAAYAGGGNLETIREGVSGVFFSEQSPESLSDVIRKTDFSRFSVKDCQRNAEKFSFGRFKDAWEKLLTELPE